MYFAKPLLSSVYSLAHHQVKIDDHVKVVKKDERLKNILISRNDTLHLGRTSRDEHGLILAIEELGHRHLVPDVRQNAKNPQIFSNLENVTGLKWVSESAIRWGVIWLYILDRPICRSVI